MAKMIMTGRYKVTAAGKMKVDTEEVPTFIFCCRIRKRKGVRT